MRYTLLLILIFITLADAVQAQLPDFGGYKIFINPGHGGHDSDDRHMVTTDFWESDGNLEKGLYLRKILQNLNATVFMSRTTNFTADDLPLSSISAMANSAGVDFFLAIHSNGFDGKQNQPLMLFRGYDDAPVYPASKEMAAIMWQKLFEKGNCWTKSNVYVKGDWTFYPEWGDKVGLGVLRNLTMPGVLSEGSHHDYIPESWRLRNNDFLHHESWALARSFIEHKNVTPVSHGLIAGVVRDPVKSPTYYFKPGTKDEALPLNGAKVTLKPGSKVYRVDNLNNGFFLFDSIPPGNYKLYFEDVQDFMDDSIQVTVLANKSVLADIYLQYDTTIVPNITSVTPPVADSLVFNQMFTISFDLSMNRDSVQKAIVFNPAVQLTYVWNENNTVLKVKPVVQYSPKTNYTVTISTIACSKWKIKLAAPFQFSFVTKNRTKLDLKDNFPGTGKNGISLYPQIKLVFDAPLDPAGISTNIQILNEAGQPLSRVREEMAEKDGNGIYSFELSGVLELNKPYRLILNRDLADIAGVNLGADREITFTTRAVDYPAGSVIEQFDDISRFWDPEASGSTVGTDNPLTTFTSSPVIKRSGTASGRLDYVFVNSVGGVCRVFNNLKPSIGYDANRSFGIWVFGDLSYNLLEYWFYSTGTTNQIVSVDTIDWAGWELKSIPYTKIGGSGERNYHSVVIRQTNAGEKSGTIFFDAGTIILPTAIDESPDNQEYGFLSYPNPFSSSSSVTFTLSEKSDVRLAVYTLSGQKVDEVLKEVMEPGSYERQWTPSASLPNGMYLYRLEIRSISGGNPVVITRKSVFIRR